MFAVRKNPHAGNRTISQLPCQHTVGVIRSALLLPPWPHLLSTIPLLVLLTRKQ